MDRKAEIAIEIYEAVRHLNARSDLLTIIGSWGDTMDDEWVVDALRQWNARQPPIRGISEPADFRG